MTRELENVWVSHRDATWCVNLFYELDGDEPVNVACRIVRGSHWFGSFSLPISVTSARASADCGAAILAECRDEITRKIKLLSAEHSREAVCV